MIATCLCSMLPWVADLALGQEFTATPVLIGNPARSQFPKEDVSDSQARNVLQLQLYENRIYVSSSAWHQKQSCVQIWSFAADATGATNIFVAEYLTHDHGIDVFRVYGGKLYVPGLDRSDGTDNGNLYVKENGIWHRRPPIPGAIHVLDAAIVGATLYVSTITRGGQGPVLLASKDDGQTWIRCTGERCGQLWEILSLAGTLFATGNNGNAYCCRDTTIECLPFGLWPCGTNSPGYAYRLRQYGTGAVYTWCDKRRNPDEDSPRPLYWLNDLAKGPAVVDAFKNKQVRDVVVRDSVCFVLCGSRDGQEGPQSLGTEHTPCAFTAEVFSSPDMKAWTREFSLRLPALPSALEVTDKAFFIGLANSRPGKSADSASGNIYSVKRSR
ncbi:MAG: hypothetical protein PHW60_14895 [Kiritimatiellae bacterium]|nr:hypothetical protein [Kiritimatiellia bacterium]